MKKRLLASFLVVCLLTTLFPTVAMAAATTDQLKDHIRTDTKTPVGTTINLFDYWTSNDATAPTGNDWVEASENVLNGGINSGHALKFSTGVGNIGTSINQWTGQAGIASTGMVSRTLIDGYPQLQAGLTYTANGDQTTDTESLAYLFDPTISHAGKASYPNVSGLLTVGDQGYYTYDSSEYFAEFDGSNSFIVYDAPAVKSYEQSTDTAGQFFPFNKGTDVFTVQGDELISTVNSNNCVDGSNYGQLQNVLLNHYFGLTMTTQFMQQYGGYTDDTQSERVTYHFSGDDDVWIYIDGVLVADLGGCHNTITVDIDFSTGDVIVTHTANGGATAEPQVRTTLKEIFEAANMAGDSSDWSGNTFSDGTYHTMNFFYLERGNVDSNMNLKFNLKEIPPSYVVKVDQDGNTISNVGFELYVGDSETGFVIAEGSTDNRGELVFMYNDGVKKGHLLSLQDVYNEYSKDPQYLDDYGNVKLTLVENEVQAGYRHTDSVPLYIQKVGEGNTADYVMRSDDRWSNGAYAVSTLNVRADTTIAHYTRQTDGTPTNDTKEVNLDDGGILFAVPLFYHGTGTTEADRQDQDNWYPLTGSNLTGWHRVVYDAAAGERFINAAITAAQERAFVFEKATDGNAYEASITDLPGEISTYYYMLDAANKENTKFTIAYYYTEANSLAAATLNNTYQVASDDFDRDFSVKIYVPNIENRLIVQKVDEAGTAINGAHFTLYQATVDNSGNWRQFDAANAIPVTGFEHQATRTLTTANDRIDLEGGLILYGIPEGNYYLMEDEGLAGYRVNSTPIKVVVDNTGVYADAGQDDDGVTVFRGVGSIVKSMAQFATNDAIDATLHDIKAALVRGTTVEELKQAAVDWNERTNEVRHLHYKTDEDAGSGELEYVLDMQDRYPTPTISVTSGWSRLAIQQDNYDDNPLKDDLEERDITNLFSGTVTVRVANKAVGDLTISKTVEKADIPTIAAVDEPEMFTFPISFTFTAPTLGEDVDLDEIALAGTYAYEIADESGTLTIAGNDTDGYAITEMKNSANTDSTHFDSASQKLKLAGGQSLTIKDLPVGTGYTVSEDKADGYITTATDNGTAVTAGQDGLVVAGAIARAGDNRTVAFTNTHELGLATLAGSDALKVSKTVTGDEWPADAEFTFTIERGSDMPADAPLPNPAKITLTKTQPSGSFSNIVFDKTGTYVYTIREQASGINGMTDDATQYTVTVKVAQDAADPNQLTATVAYTADDDPNFTYGADGMAFENAYKEPEMPDLKVTKEITAVNGTEVTAAPTKVEVNNTITWTITVENTGNVELSNITVEDELTIDGAAAVLDNPDSYDFTIASLAKGETKTIEVSYTVQPEDAGKVIVNTATAADGNGTEDEGESEVTVKKLGLTVTKEPDQGTADVGDTIIWTITVSNDGTEDLKDVIVEDIFGKDISDLKIQQTDAGVEIYNPDDADDSGDTDNADDAAAIDADGTGDVDDGNDNTTAFTGKFKIASLPAGEKKEIVLSYEVKDTDAGKTIANKVTVEGTTDEGDPDDDEDTSEVTVNNPGLSVTKTEDKDKAKVGETITWTIDVKNTGNVKLTSITVMEDLKAAGNFTLVSKTANVNEENDGTFTIAALDVNETATIKVSYIVQLADANGKIINTATAGNGDEEEEGKSEVSAEPALSVTKIVSQSSAYVGDTLTYTIKVTNNTTDTTLNNIKVQDPLMGAERVIAQLAPGVTETLTYTYQVKAADKGTLSNNVKVTADEGPSAEAAVQTTVKEKGGTSGGSGGTSKPNTGLNTEDHYSYIIGYKDGYLRPYGTITRGEVATIFFRLLTDETREEYWSQTNKYSDCDSDLWCNNAISTLTRMGIIDGYEDGTFRPYSKITRAAFAKIAVGFFETTREEYAGFFTDVDIDAWYTEYVEAAARVGLIQGFQDGTFRPETAITRAQACVIVNRALGRKPQEDHLLSQRQMLTWPDNNPGDWYYADMQEATNSHDYAWTTLKGEKIENWTKKLEQRDWAALEHAWSTAHSAPGGEVVK